MVFKESVKLKNRKQTDVVYNTIFIFSGFPFFPKFHIIKEYTKYGTKMKEKKIIVI